MSRPASALAAIGAFALLLAGLPLAEPLFRLLFPEVAQPAYTREPLALLAGEHLLLVLAALVPASLLGIGLGIAATRPGGAELRTLADALAAVAQAVPPVAIIALALPALGFGAAPTVLALVAYVTLPVLRQTVAALESLPAGVVDAARGCGMTPRQILTGIELPLARAPIVAAIRVAGALAVATAAVGAIAGASCLGTPIIAGLVNGNPAWVVQGALLTGALALAVDRSLALLLPATEHDPQWPDRFRSV
jgi:osmoprotectant transport system permease protein